MTVIIVDTEKFNLFYDIAHLHDNDTYIILHVA